MRTSRTMQRRIELGIMEAPAEIGGRPGNPSGFHITDLAIRDTPVGGWKRQGSIKGDLAGQRFGRLLAVEATDERAANGSVMWECVCSCGTTTLVGRAQLRDGRVTSCGCVRGQPRPVPTIEHDIGSEQMRDLVEALPVVQAFLVSQVFYGQYTIEDAAVDAGLTALTTEEVQECLQAGLKRLREWIEQS